MKYTVRIRYNDGIVHSWLLEDRTMARYVIQKELNRFGKQITNLTLKGVRV